jgi:hypothetical protein
MRSVRTLLAAGLLAVPALVAVTQATVAAAACPRVPSDFNGDGRADLVAGVPQRTGHLSGEPPTPVIQAGGVHVLYGSPSGFTNGPFYDPETQGMPEGHEFGGSNHFGDAFAAGLFDGDCYGDLAIGASHGSQVLVMYGSATGLHPEHSAVFTSPEVFGDRTDDQGDGFGAALAAGDFNHDGFDDLAGGAPWGFDEHGAVGVLFGSADGITTTGASFLTQDSPNVPGGAEFSDSFGSVLAAGDVTGDGMADLVASAPGESVGSLSSAGGVLVLPGGPAGPSGTGAQWWDQNSPGVPGSAEEWDSFGAALAIGDLTGDGRADLAIGAPGEDIGNLDGAGMVTVLKGAAGGLTATGALAWDQNDPQIPGSAELNDGFGSPLVIGDVNHDSRTDLVIGVSNESAGAIESAGALNILYGNATGISPAGSTYLDQNSAGVPGSNEAYDNFGSALRLLPTGLVVGAIGESADGTKDGAFTVLTGTTGTFYSGSKLPGGAVDESWLGGSLG